MHAAVSNAFPVSYTCRTQAQQPKCRVRAFQTIYNIANQIMEEIHYTEGKPICVIH